jgi:hypothetical protein
MPNTMSWNLNIVRVTFLDLGVSAVYYYIP